MRRLTVYKRRARRYLNYDEIVVAAIPAHKYRWMVLLPEFTFYLFGRMVVVTDDRVILFGPGFRTMIDQARSGSGAIRRDGSRMYFAGAYGSEQSLYSRAGEHRELNRVVTATTA